MPGFDFNNPFGGADPFGDPFAARRQPALVQPLAPAEQEGVLSRLTDYGLGGLGWLGETLDKSLGGRTVRGLLGGKGVGESLAHLIPFSDTLGVTDPSQAVSGKELLGFDKHDDSWTGFLGGLGAEILLDPGTYTSFGSKALTKLGKAAEKAGVMPKELAARARGFKFGSAEADALARQAHNIPMGPVPASAIADVADKPLGGAMTFMGNVVGGERPAALIDKAKDALLYSKPVTQVAPLFDPRLHEFGPAPYTAAGQREARAGSERLAKQKADALKSHFESSNLLREAGLENDAAGLRSVVEGGGYGPMPQGKEALLEVGGPLKGKNVARLEQARDMGRKISEWESQYGEHFPRQMTPDANQALSTIKDKRFGQVQTPQSRPRIEELDIPGLTTQTNALLSDPQAAAPLTDRAARKQARKYTREALGYDQAEVNALNQIPFQPVPAGPNFPLTAEQAQRAAQLKSLRKSGNYLSDWASRLPDEFRAGLVTKAGQDVLDNAPPVVQQMLQAGTVKPQDVLKALQQPGGEDLLSRGRQFFGNSPLGDATVAQLAHQKAQEGAKVFYDTLKSAATTVKGEGHKSIAEILQKSGFQTITDASGNVRGAQPQMLQRLEAAGLIPPGSKPGVLKQVFVPGEVADDVLRFGQSFAMPENLKPVLNAWDYMTNLTKTGQTVLWPAFHARNFLSGLWQNLVGGAGYHGVGGLDLVSGLRDAHTLRTGGVLPWANTVEGLRHLNPEDASRQILELAYAHGAREPAGKMVANELLGRAPHEVGAGELGSFAGRTEKPMMQSLKEGLGLLPDPTNPAVLGDRIGGKLNPTNWGRGNPLDYSNFAPAKAGREISHVTDDYNRLAGFLGYLQQGYTPETAAMRIKGLHWSGGGQNFAPFEREVMRRLVPFYGWCVPEDCEILTRDGWKKVDGLMVGEDVLSLDHLTGESHWVPCEGKETFPYCGVLMTLGGEREEFAFTANHKWPVIAHGVEDTRRMVEGYQLRSNHSVPRTSIYREELSVATPREASAIGWLVTDGHMKHDGNHVGMTIYQSPNKFLEEIIALLGSDGTVGKPHPETGVVPVYVVGAFRRRLQELLPSKDKICSFVGRLSRESAQACYDAMLKAEGGFTDTWTKFSQFGQPVLDAFQMLAQMVGRVAHQSTTGAYVSKAGSSKKVAGCLGTKWYTGRVWCPTTKYGTWLMRRNGRIIWTGNSRQNIPFQLQQLLEKPGGLTAQATRATGELRQQDGLLPDWIGEGPAIPLGAREGNTQRYLSSFGLPFEDLNRIVSTGPNSTKRTMQQLLGDLNPMLKGPLEYATGMQLYSGRQMDDLYSRTGNPVLDQIVMNSPLSRALTMASTAADPRKGLTGFATNFVSPFRVTDVDMVRAADIQARRFVEEQLQGNPNVRTFQNFYLTPQQAQTVDPQTLETLRMYRTLVDQAKARSAANQPAPAFQFGR